MASLLFCAQVRQRKALVIAPSDSYLGNKNILRSPTHAEHPSPATFHNLLQVFRGFLLAVIQQGNSPLENFWKIQLSLEAQQRFCSYRATLVAIVLRSPVVLSFWLGGGIAQASRVLQHVWVNESTKRRTAGGSTPLWDSAKPTEKVPRDMGYCSNRSQYYAI